MLFPVIIEEGKMMKEVYDIMFNNQIGTWAVSGPWMLK